jgi:hypothetical protein
MDYQKILVLAVFFAGVFVPIAVHIKVDFHLWPWQYIKRWKSANGKIVDYSWAFNGVASSERVVYKIIVKKGRKLSSIFCHVSNGMMSKIENGMYVERNWFGRVSVYSPTVC